MDHIYRMVIVEGRCTMARFWLVRYNGLVWSNIAVPMLLPSYTWSLIFSDFPDLFRWLCWRRMLWLMFVLSCVCGARPELFAHSFVPARQARECHYHHFNFKFQSLHSQSMYIHVFHFISQLKNENLSGRQLIYIFSF